MRDEIEFVDTNIIVYAHDRTAGLKREIARSLLVRLDANRKGALSLQVLQEFAVTILAKDGNKFSDVEVEETIEDLSDWIVFCPGPHDVIASSRLCVSVRGSGNICHGFHGSERVNTRGCRPEVLPGE